jgi:hypothetical protein
MPVVGGALLRAVGFTDAAVHIEYDSGLRRKRCGSDLLNWGRGASPGYWG